MPAAQALLGAEYDTEMEDAAKAPEAAAVEQQKQQKPCTGQTKNGGYASRRSGERCGNRRCGEGFGGGGGGGASAAAKTSGLGY